MANRISITILILLSMTSFAGAQWQKIQGLNGEPIWDMASSVNRLFVNTQYGVLESTDGGNTWTQVPDLWVQNFTNTIDTYFDTVVVYAIPESYISTDDGLTWTLFNNPTQNDIAEIVYDEGMMYAASFFDGFYYSPNQGFSWGQVATGLPAFTTYYAVAAEGGAYVYLASDDGLFISDDDGFSFTIAPTPLLPTTFSEVYASGNYVFAYGNNEIYKSPDNGLSWSVFDAGAPAGKVTDFLLEGGNVFACIDSFIVRTDTAAANWVIVNNGLDPNEATVMGVYNNNIFAGTSLGVYKSSTNGNSWSNSSTGIDPLAIDAIEYHNSFIHVAANTFGLNRYHWPLQGWVYNGYNGLDLFSFDAAGDTVFMGNMTGLDRSDDNGGTWVPVDITNPSGVSDAFDIVVRDSMMVSATLASSVLISTDYGNTWAAKGSGSGLGGLITSCTEISGTNIVAGTSTDGVYLSVDYGDTWTQVVGAGQGIYDLAVIGDHVIASAFGPNGNYLSTDNGATWSPTNSLGTLYLTVSQQPTQDVLLASDGITVYTSLDSGATYPITTPGPTDLTIRSIDASLNELFIGTDEGGVWWISLFDITGIESQVKPPAHAKVYPNPTSGLFVIGIPDNFNTANSVLQFFDISGRMISEFDIHGQSGKFIADMSSAAPGLYHFIASNAYGEQFNGKVIIK